MEELLKELIDEVKLLTVKTKANALRSFYGEFLKNANQRQMYEAFDGERTLQEISDAIECKLNTLQVFTQKLVECDLVDVATRGKFRIINKNISKIAIYYANRDLAYVEVN